MKTKLTRISTRTFAVILSLMVLITSITLGSVITTRAAGPYTIYMIPKADMANAGTTYRLNYKNTDDTWGQASFSFTGRTYQGRPVYSTTFSPSTTNSYNCQLQVGTGSSFSWDLYAGSHAWSSWSGKYFDANGSGSWNSSITFDTYQVYNKTTSLGSMTWSSSSSKYTLSASLTGGTTYKIRVYNGNYGYGSKYFQCDAKTLTATGSTDMYAYDSASDSAVISITPTITSTYTFEWTLTDSQNDNSKVYIKKGSLNITVPTIRTISYTLGSNVSYVSVSGGTKTADGTIKAQSGSNVAITVSYATGYEYDSSNSSLGGATVSNSNKTFTYSSISGNKTLSVKAKLAQYNITIQSSNSSYGSVSPTSYSNVPYGESRSISATTIGSNTAFVNWTASPAANVEFTDSGLASTTFKAYGAATITANFTTDTLYSVDVYNGVSQTHSTVNAGSVITPELTAITPDDDEYAFSGWTLSGNVQLVSGYTTSDQTIKIKATGTGGSVTANYTKTDYIYFYAALQSNWSSNPVVTVDGSAVSAYAWLSSYTASNTPKTLYSNSTGTQIGGNSCYTYYIGVYRVPVAKAGKNISVFNSTQTGTDANKGYCGTLTNDQGRCYYTYSTAADSNVSGTIAPQKVTAVTVTQSNGYDADKVMTIGKTETVYYGTKTAGQDTFTYTYKVLNSSTNAVVATLGENLASSTGNVTFTPQDEGITTSGSYKVRIYTYDAKTNKIINYKDSSAFNIYAVPTSSTVSASATNGAVSIRKYTYQNVATNATFSNGASLRAGSTVTITMTLNEGYTQGTTTAKFGTSNLTLTTNSYNSSTRVLTLSFTVPSGGSAITISHAASEITHTVTVKRRYYNFDGSTLQSTDSSAYATLTGVGITTGKSTGAAPTVANYTFKTFTLPEGVTLKSGSLTTTAAITVNATVDNATIYIDYWETVYDITVASGGNGVVKRGSTQVSGSTTKIGYVTAVALTAVPSEGYIFKEWVITKGTAANAKVGSNTYTLGSSATTIPAATAGATSNFYFNGTATITANFQAVDYSVSADFPSGNSYTLNSTTGNNVTTSIDHGSIGDTFTIDVLLADGYDVASITGTGISSTMPTPTVSGRTKSYQYTLGSQSVVAVVTLKAKTPTLSNVYIKNKTNYTSWATTYASGATVEMYYNQPVMAKATTDSFSNLNYYTYKSNGTTTYSSKTNQASQAEVSLNPDPDIIPTTEDGYVNYTFKVIASNKPAGITTAATKTNTYTIKVTFNDAQKAHFKLKRLFDKCISETATNNPYYKVGAPIAAYNTAYSSAQTVVNSGYPVYNASSSVTSSRESSYNDFQAAYDSLKSFAKTTTVHILANYANSASAPINITAKYENTDDWKHFYMLTSEENSYKSGTNTTDGVYKTTYDGYVTKSTSRYMYSITYYGHISFNVWKGTSATDVTVATTKQITGDITKPADFKEYYVNVYNTAVGSTSVTSATEYTDFGHTWDTSSKKLIDIGAAKTKAQLVSLFNVAASGSMVTGSNPGITTANTAMTVVGPIGKASSKTYDLMNTASADYVSSFPADKSGRYRVNYTTRFGYDASGNAILRTAVMTLYVATDDIDVYVDMNGNVGSPVINFKYWVNSSGDPVASGTSGATAAYLPYEMELATGSESVYKYTIKISKLQTDYKLNFTASSPFVIDYITVENEKIGQSSGGFQISTEARVTGEVWFKADKTKLTTFNNISYGSIRKSFMAVDASNNYLSTAIKSVHGTGIVTDEDITDTNSNEGELYEAKYAAVYTLDGQTNPISNFTYNIRATAKEEFTYGNNTYYFDKWVSVPTPAEGAVDMTQAVDYSDKADITFNKAVEYGDGSSDTTYIAKYKVVSSGDSTVRVEVTYNFKDYDTSDGNYVYNPDKKTVDASYTKTIKVKVGSGETYANFNAVNNVTALNSIVSSAANMPLIKSNYYDYSYTANSVAVDASYPNQSKIVVHASFTHTPHAYKIIVKDGNSVVSTNSGYYQQTVDLTTTKSNPAWKDSNDYVLATGASYTARYVSSGNESNSGTDCQIIKVVSDSSATVTNKSVITNSYTEQYYDGTVKKLQHNFYIVDYCAEGKLVGGGVLYATRENGAYRQSNATTKLASVTSRRTFISDVLGGDYATEYAPQSISNIGFRYKPYNEKEDVYRYSDVLNAYQYIFTGTNNNTEEYEGQTLRVFSFMVYNSGTAASPTYVIVPSEGYADVSRYIP